MSGTTNVVSTSHSVNAFWIASAFNWSIPNSSNWIVAGKLLINCSDSHNPRPVISSINLTIFSICLSLLMLFIFISSLEFVVLEPATRIEPSGCIANADIVEKFKLEVLNLVSIEPSELSLTIELVVIVCPDSLSITVEEPATRIEPSGCTVTAEMVSKIVLFDSCLYFSINSGSGDPSAFTNAIFSAGASAYLVNWPIIIYWPFGVGIIDEIVPSTWE